MIAGKKVLGVIPARGGSKGIPRKNIVPVAGKPLIAWTIEQALKSKYIDRLILTSDDEEIIQVAREWGCDAPFKRPAEFAQDNTSGIAPVIHAINQLHGYEYVVLLQPTSPLRNVDDIDGCIKLCIRQERDFCISLCKSDKPPTWMYHLNEEHDMSPIINSEHQVLLRQDAEEIYLLNGAVYVANCAALLEQKTFLTPHTGGYIMPKERSIDIDTDLDLIVAKALLERYRE